jgi:hypothetical protein
VVKVPTNQLTFVGVGFLLNRVVNDQHAVRMLDLATVGLTTCQRSAEVKRRLARKRVIWSWLTGTVQQAGKAGRRSWPQTRQADNRCTDQTVAYPYQILHLHCVT